MSLYSVFVSQGDCLCKYQIHLFFQQILATSADKPLIQHDSKDEVQSEMKTGGNQYGMCYQHLHNATVHKTGAGI